MENNTAAKKISLEERVAIIAPYPLFSILKQQDLQIIAAQMKELYVTEKTIIVREGEVVDYIYLIIEGSAVVSKTISNGGGDETIQLATLGKGDSIGLSDTGFFSQSGVRTATVTATSPMMLLALSTDALSNFLQSYNPIV